MIGIKDRTEGVRAFGFGAEAIAILSLLGYGITYMFEKGAFEAVGVSTSLISIGINQIVPVSSKALVCVGIFCGVTFEPTLQLLRESGLQGRFLYFLFVMCVVGAYAAFTWWLDDPQMFFFAVVLVVATSVSSLRDIAQQGRVVNLLRAYFSDLSGRIWAGAFVCSVVLSLSPIAGQYFERKIQEVTVIEVPCGPPARVFRIAGDNLIVLDQAHALNRSYALVPVSSGLRLIVMSVKEFRARSAIVGPCKAP